MLQYLSFSRTDIAYTVLQVCMHMHTPQEPHLTALKRILLPPWLPRLQTPTPTILDVEARGLHRR
jgi:hypothetical protein